MFEADSLVLG